MYKKATLLALCMVFTLSGCAVIFALLPQPLKAGLKYVAKYLRDEPECNPPSFTASQSNNKEDPPPKWICTVPPAKVRTGVYGVGIAEWGGHRSMQRRIAQHRGRVDIAAAIQTQVVSQEEEVGWLKTGLCKSSDSSPTESATDTLNKISKSKIITKNSSATHTEGIVHGARFLTGYYAPDGTFYALMGIIEEQDVKDSKASMIKAILAKIRQDLRETEKKAMEDSAPSPATPDNSCSPT